MCFDSVSNKDTSTLTSKQNRKKPTAATTLTRTEIRIKQ